jgi:hypothetical protein
MWLKVTESDAVFSKDTSGVTISTLPAQLVLSHPQLLSGVTTVGGYSVKRVSERVSLSRREPLPALCTFDLTVLPFL